MPRRVLTSRVSNTNVEKAIAQLEEKADIEVSDIDVVKEITKAAKFTQEQTDGIGQVSTAVVQLDQMTQQNAALVEQSAAAAMSLKDQATRLADVVRTFRLDSR